MGLAACGARKDLVAATPPRPESSLEGWHDALTGLWTPHAKASLAIRIQARLTGIVQPDPCVAPGHEPIGVAPRPPAVREAMGLECVLDGLDGERPPIGRNEEEIEVSTGSLGHDSPCGGSDRSRATRQDK